MEILNITDGVIALSFIIFFLLGWKKGLFRTILGPIIFIICIGVGIAHYRENQILTQALLIITFGPIVLNIFFWVLIKIFGTKKDKDSPRSTISSFLGAVFCVLWRGPILVLLILLIANIPIHFSYLEKLQNNILESYTYSFIYNNYGNKIPALNISTKGLAEVLDDPEKLKELQSKDAYTELMNNKKVQSLYSDEGIQKQIEEHNYSELLKNSKIQEILRDKELIKNFFELHKEIRNINNEESK